MIRPQDISIVVQGPIAGRPSDPPSRRLTLQCLESVRKFLPGAEVILSTWRGSDLSGLPPVDRVVECDDPGAIICDVDPEEPTDTPRIFYNANRQIVSTRDGLLQATRPYAMKLRSDMVMTGLGFLHYFGRYRARHSDWRLLRERVLTCSMYSRNPHKRIKYPFHPSDWFHFGLREDVLNIWDIPLAPEPEIPRWFDTRPRAEADIERWAAYRYTVEQYIWISFLRKYGDIPFDHKIDHRHDSIAVSELTIANNLVIAESTQYGVAFRKYPMDISDWMDNYTHGDWQRLYQRYCDPAARVWPDLMVLRKRAAMVNRSALEFWWDSGLRRALKRTSPGVVRAAKRVHSLIFSPDNPQ